MLGKRWVCFAQIDHRCPRTPGRRTRTWRINDKVCDAREDETSRSVAIAVVDRYVDRELDRLPHRVCHERTQKRVVKSNRQIALKFFDSHWALRTCV
jgi:hypothetical protein